MTPIEWLLSGDTGISSKTICAVMTGSNIGHPDIPYDASDFGRCYRLLKHFPEWRARLHEVSSAYPIWGPMVEAWDELSNLYQKERDNKEDCGLSERMRELVDAGRIAEGWKRVGEYCWEEFGVKVVEAGGKA